MLSRHVHVYTILGINSSSSSCCSCSCISCSTTHLTLETLPFCMTLETVPLRATIVKPSSRTEDSSTVFLPDL
ncbi:hypothetical protein M0802_008192 [Mischocyttarus mexicanus]|nr:hypothetical protein M0802_008192 [Mischocyttarus mexicanus]